MKPRLRRLADRYCKFSRRPLRLPILIGAIMALAGVLTLGSLIVFWGSDTHRYIVDVQRASDNRLDDPDFPLIVPPEALQAPAEPPGPEHLQQAGAAIRVAAEALDPEADFPPPVSGLDFVDQRSRPEDSR